MTIPTHKRCQFVDITAQVQEMLNESGIANGIVTLFVPHTTAGLTVNENADPDVTSDMDMVLDRIVPWSGGYRHFEGNTAAHVKASMMGVSCQIIVFDGQLCLGTWQSIYFCEFDGPRTRKCWFKIHAG